MNPNRRQKARTQCHDRVSLCRFRHRSGQPYNRPPCKRLHHSSLATVTCRNNLCSSLATATRHNNPCSSPVTGICRNSNLCSSSRRRPSATAATPGQHSSGNPAVMVSRAISSSGDSNSCSAPSNSSSTTRRPRVHVTDPWSQKACSRLRSPSRRHPCRAITRRLRTIACRVAASVRLRTLTAGLMVAPIRAITGLTGLVSTVRRVVSTRQAGAASPVLAGPVSGSGWVVCITMN